MKKIEKDVLRDLEKEFSRDFKNKIFFNCLKKKY